MSKTNKQRRSQDVPPKDHIARYCNPQRVIRDLETNDIIGVRPQAFELRPKIKEKYLSIYWMEALATEIHKQFKRVVESLRKKHPNVKPDGAFARLNAGLVLQAGQVRKLPIRILNRSTKHDPGYSGIYGMPLDNSDLQFLALLAYECCIEVRGVVAIDALP
jgi:hypothetical protein